LKWKSDALSSSPSEPHYLRIWTCEFQKSVERTTLQWFHTLSSFFIFWVLIRINRSKEIFW
jgi:hypothetical protein